MAESHNQGHGNDTKEASGCGMFDFLGKKEEKPEIDVVVTDSKGKNEEDKQTLMEELHRSHSQSSSLSEEEIEEGGERKKKKKKGLKEKIKEKISGDNEDNVKEPDAAIPAEKCHDTGSCEATHGDEKKGFLEKIKKKLPGQRKKTEEAIPTAHPEYASDGHSPREATEKKGILEKIKDKLPGAHKNVEDEVKHKDN